MNTQRIQQRVLALAIAMLAFPMMWATMTGHELHTRLLGDRLALTLTISAVLLGISLLTFMTSFDVGRSHAFMRLDWFVPTLKRLKANPSPSHTFLGRWLRSVIPKSFQSDRRTKKRGWIRKTIRWFGISWLASPVRRVVQGISLVLFLTLFFVVCYPYSARPATQTKPSQGWTLETIDQQNGEFSFFQSSRFDEASLDWTIRSGETVFIAKDRDDHKIQSQRTVSAGNEFFVVSVEDGRVRLKPIADITPQLLDLLLAGSDSFAVHQHDPLGWPRHYADNLADKELIPAESFLVIDPLVSLSTAIASRSWVWSLVSAAAIVIVCVLIPRGFCGYLCPLGTTIDLFDWAIAGRMQRLRVPDDGWWVHIKYYLLAGTLVAAIGGVLVSGFFAAIPVITRAMLFLIDPIQNGATRGWHQNPGFGVSEVVSILMFAAVLFLGFLRPRFWCKYVCPSGAVFSIGNLFRLTERKVESSCIHCNKCVEICPFDAIKPDFTTRTSDCTMCQTCGGVCPTHAIKFVERWNVVELKVADEPPTHETALGRRGFLSLATGSTAAAIGGIGIAAATKSWGANLDDPNAFRPVRPPGSVPEKEFLEMCIRCGECFKACPNNVLQPESFQQGLEGLWTPMVVADWAGCESSCNACGQVCPTGSIRALPIEEKRVARMGLAVVNKSTCLPFAGNQACDLCVQECDAAGYHAIEFTLVGTQIDSVGKPIDGTGYLAPLVLDDKCVGCGLCQTRCYAINVKEEKLLTKSAIIIEAGDGNEDRLMSGSYLELRQEERDRKRQEDHEPALPAEPRNSEPAPDANNDPFGLSG